MAQYLFLFIHQDSKIIYKPCKYSDQIFHAEIKPRTILQMKTQKYSNTVRMNEQRGNFDGINTCSIIQFRNFQITSFLLQENVSRRICNHPDINALLDQFVKEKLIPFECAKYSQKSITKYRCEWFMLQCYICSCRKAIQMQQTDHIVLLVWDGSPNEEEKETENFICIL